MLTFSNIATATDLSQSFTYQGRFYNAAGTAPLGDVVDLLLDVYDPSGTCLLYEESQINIDLTGTNGLFAVQVGSSVGDAKRTASDPGLAMAKVFANSSAPLRTASVNCSSGYTPTAADSRFLRVTVTPHSTLVPSTLVPDQLIGSQASSLVAQTLGGLDHTSFIQAAAGVANQGGVSLNSLKTLTGGSSTDASALHNHDSLYIRASGGSTDLGGGTAFTTGSFGVGTAVPTADIGLGGTIARTIQVERNTVAGSAGNNLVLAAGGAASGGTDQSGGNLILSSGVATGAGGSAIQFNTASAGAAGSLDRAPSSKMTLTSDGRLGVGTQTPGAQVEINASSASTKGQIIKGASSQTGNLLELQNNTGGVLSFFDAAGNLNLPGDPTSNMQAATKQYVQAALSSGSVSSFNTRSGAVSLTAGDVSTALGYDPVDRAGDTLTGALVLAADPTSNLGAATKQYVTTMVGTKQPAGNYVTALTGDISASGPGSAAAVVNSVGGSTALAVNTATGLANGATNTNTVSTLVKRDASGNFAAGSVTADLIGNVTGSLIGNVTGAASSNILKAGDSMSGLLVLSADPSGALGAATKQYVDTKQANLGFTPVNRAGDTLTGNLRFAATTTLGLGSYSNGQESTLIGSLSAADIGMTWYNTNSNFIKYWNGTIAQTLGVSGTGLTSLNGLTGTTQTFANGAAGTSPAFNSSGTAHTLNIPLASAGGSVTAGLISNADYVSFNSKQGALGYAPVSRAGDSLSGDLVLAGNPAALLSATSKQYVDTGLAGKQASGSYLSTLTGDVTASGNGSVPATVALVGGSTAANVNTATIAANSATSLNTVSKIVARDPSGNFSAGTITGALAGAASSNVLKSGDAMSGALTLPTNGLIA
ncbi:MAG: hypothetical protein ABI041_20285, partial [Bdellovibrionia bacterium]